MSTKSKQKLLKIIASLGVEEEPAAVSAFLMARRHMRMLGFTWSDIAQAALGDDGLEARPVPKNASSDAFNNGVYRRPTAAPGPKPKQRPAPESRARATSEPQPAAAPKPEPEPAPESTTRSHETTTPANFRQAFWAREIRTGADIPAVVSGMLKVVNEKSAPNGEVVMIVRIEAETVIYDSLAIVDQDLVTMIKRRLGTGNRLVDADIRQIRNPDDMPIVTALRM